MRYIFIGLLLLSCGCHLHGQTYAEAIAAYRKQYIADLLAEPRHPLQPQQARDVTFFAPDERYKLQAEVKITPGSVPILVPTHSGKFKPFREYCTLTCRVHDSAVVLHAYQSVDLVNAGAHKDELFVPFKDISNYETTYGGGRYIDLSVNDIKDGRIEIDFNKCYNPYCAYSDGFSCPIPPRENYLSVEIPVGEKAFPH